MTERPRLPGDDEHVAVAGRTGSGKTVGALSMLAYKDLTKQPWVIVDHKGDQLIKSLDLPPIRAASRILPDKGLHHLRFVYGKDDPQDLENFLARCLRRGNIGIYVDEGHLMHKSASVRNILVSGRQPKVSLMWTSQRAAWIDTFIWSQASFYRVFALQTIHDVKRFNENFPVRHETLPAYHSHYYDVSKGEVYYLSPSPTIDVTKKRIDAMIRHRYSGI